MPSGFFGFGLSFVAADVDLARALGVQYDWHSICVAFKNK